MYLDDSQRLDKTLTPAMELKRERYAKRAEDEHRLMRKRYENQLREDARWERMQQECVQEAARVQEMRQRGLKAKRNETSVPYDLITLNYGTSEEAQRLRMRDEMTRYRAQVRMYNLQQKQNMHGTNPITGEVLDTKPCPVRPDFSSYETTIKRGSESRIGEDTIPRAEQSSAAVAVSR